MATQADVVAELYRRIDTLAPDKQAIVQELAKRFNVSGLEPPAGTPDAGAQMRAGVLGQASAMMADNSAPVPVHPYGGAPTLETPAGDSYLETPRRGAISMVDGASQIADASSADDVAGGAHKVISGGMQVLSPTLLYAGATAPLATGLGLAGGDVAGKTAHAGLKAAGASDNVADLGGDIAGLAGGMAAGHVGPRVVSRGVGAATDAVRSVGLPRSGTPEQRAAVDWALANGAPLDAGAATLNPVVRGTQEIARNTIFAGAAAEKAINARQQWYATKGQELAQQVSPTPQTPETAGRAVYDAGIKNIQDANAEANEAYASLRAREQNPDSWAEVQTGTQPETRQMQVGTKQVPVPGVVGLDGSPAMQDVPVMQNVTRDVPVTERMPMPVDMREFKAQLAPQLEQIQRATRLGQSQFAPAQIALEDIVNGPDFKPASSAELDLSGLKRVSRDNTLTGGVKNDAGALASSMIPRLQSAIDDAVSQYGGADALTDLQEGRMKTAAKYGAIDLADQLRSEPVQTTKLLMSPGDQHIDLLTQVSKLAPDQMPLLGRAWLDQRLAQATESGGFDHAQKLFNDWQNLGDKTKQIVFRDPQMISDLDKFFQSAKDSSKVENTSGTARVAHISGQTGAAGSALGLAVVGHPLALGVQAGYTIGMNGLSRLLYNPRFVRAAIRAMDTPADSAGAVPAAQNLMAVAGGAARQANAPGFDEPNPTQNQGNIFGMGSPYTVVTVPGEAGNSYKARYTVKDLHQVQPSHSGQTFLENPKFGLENQRNYGTAVNQGKIVGWATPSEFQPSELISDVSNATSGPPVVDAQGNVLGGNGRTMIMQRVYAGNPKGAAAYRDLLMQKAPQFGIDPAEVAKMKNPLLVREVPDSEFSNGRSKQNAIADFNKTGTAALTPAEQAISDSRRVSSSTLDDVATKLEAKGADSSLADVLEGKSGKEVLGNLVKDGVVTTQERAGLETDNELTPAGKARVQQLMLGRFFSDPGTLDTLAPSLRNKVARLAAPLAQVEGRGEWNLTPDMQAAVELLHRAQALKVKNVDDFIKQDGLFGAQNYSDRAQALARALQRLNPNELTAAARQYAGDSNFAAKGPNSLFGASPTPESSFADAFEGAVENKKPAANALAGSKKVANSLAVNGRGSAPAAVASASDNDPVFHEYAGKPADAIEKLVSEKRGAATGLWTNKSIPGPNKKVGLSWGVPGDPSKNFKGGYGLAHIIAKHVEAQKDFNLADLPDLVPKLEFVRMDRGNRVVMQTPDHEAIVSLDWFGKDEHWVISAYEKKKP